MRKFRRGDLVWAADPNAGEAALKRVVRTFVSETEELIHVTVQGEEIICTPGHPFYSPVQGWTEASRLRAGDILVLVNGEFVVVEQVQQELLDAPVLVYNFEVEDFHTYFVSASGILVHNKCGYVPPEGGGGVTDSVQVGDTTVTFGHGGRHIEGSGFSTSQVNQVIAKDVVSQNPGLGVLYKGSVSINGSNIIYTAKQWTKGIINIGTYYLQHMTK